MNSNGRTLMKGLFVGGTLSLGVAGTAFFVSMNRTSAKVDDLRAEVSRLKSIGAPEVVVREVHTIREVPPLTELPSVPAVPASAGASVPEPTAEERNQQQAIINDAHVKAVRDQYGKETVDPEWSKPAEELIRKTYAAEEFRRLRVSAECRATLCKLDLSYPDQESSTVAMKALVQVHAWQGQAMTMVDQKARTASSYIAREGFDLPEADQAAIKQ